MGWRFRKRIKLFSGFYINISKSGLGVNIGPKGANVSVGSKGTYVNTGIPGTGLYRRDKIYRSIHSSKGIQQESQNYRGQEVTPNVNKEEQHAKGSIPVNYFVNDANLTHLDPLFEDAARLIVREQKCSLSLILRNFTIDYRRAVRLMDQLENAGIVGAAHGSKLREVLIMNEMSLQNLLLQLWK